VIRECEQLVQELDAIVTKTLPKNGGSWLSRKAKAIESLRYDGKIERSMLQLRKYVTTLTYDRVADLSGTPLSFAIFIVPFRRDRHFVDRAILEKVENKGQQPASRVALVGLGGVGYVCFLPKFHVHFLVSGLRRECSAVFDRKDSTVSINLRC
jgi:hypothetical protein